MRVFNFKNVLMGFVFLLCNITSVVVVTQIMGLNIPLALLMTGVNTLIFRYITKKRLASVIGISGLYIGGFQLIANKYSIEYALGGCLMSGILYVIFSLVLFKYQHKIFKYIPEYILSFAVVLIGLSLIPIATSLVSSNLLLGFVTLFVMLFVEFKAKGITRLLSMPIAIIIASIINWCINGFNIIEPQILSVTLPKFNIESFFTVSIIAFAVAFEALGDCKNTGDIMEVDIINEKGILPRIFLSNGIASILNGILGAACATTYSEQNSAVQLTGHKDTKAELWTSIMFIILAFITPFSSLILSIPSSIFGGCLLYLYGSVVINAIKQINYSNINLNTDKKPFIIMSVGLSLYFISFVIKGVTISSIAVSMLVMLIMNTIIKEGETFNE